MTTRLIDSVTITRTNIYKGAARVLVDDGTGTFASFPGELETVINPTTYVAAGGLTDLGPTTEDGVMIRREAEIDEGIPVDQRATNLDEGEPESWAMEAETTLLHTDLDTINIAWQAGTKRNISGSVVEQSSLDLDAPTTFTERMAFIVQEDGQNGRMRVFAFRAAVPAVDGSEMNIQGNEATGLPLKLKLRADESIDAGSGQFGKIFEEDA